ELEQRAAPRFRLVIGAEAAREGLGSVLTELARLLTSRFDEIVLGRHSLSPRSEIRARSARSVAARRLLLRLLVGRLQQVDLDELIEVPVEHGLRVRDLVVRTLVFDHRVGLKRVGAGLRPEADLALVAAEALFELGLPLAAGLLVEHAAEHLHRGLAVLMLRALRLTADDEARRNVADANRRLGPVDVL